MSHLVGTRRITKYWCVRLVMYVNNNLVIAYIMTTIIRFNLVFKYIMIQSVCKSTQIKLNKTKLNKIK